MEYKAGDVVLFNWTDSNYSKIITAYNYIRFRQSKCTHAGIVQRVTKNLVYICEAIGGRGGFKAYKYEKTWLEAMREEKRVIVLRSTSKVVKSTQNACKRYLGAYYDWLSIFTIIFKLSFNSTRLLFCSEAVARILYDITDKKCIIAEDYEKITPMDLYVTTKLKEIKHK